ncbi:hypothetical protein DIURU_003550 [Diutina rugosa]|uniref:Micro-fibrillar-associated protein 1 C-terminal domain-containing protein n=1 Tax=Diutina rugosa TaxID=5481 RepID=A0A642UL94_DIURU|nr:uncharacterized protein DIURU_003550 [Diutina rugosa]KAA8901180.1 hypothetical protein DIURU_003550 [Diutina rugosa]
MPSDDSDAYDHSGSSSEESSEEEEVLITQPRFVKSAKSAPSGDPSPSTSVGNKSESSVTKPLAAASEVAVTVDDTDNLDPEAEYQAWQARELARYQRQASGHV